MLMKMNYKKRVYAHLAEYKRNALEITDSGAWRGVEYSHILPHSKREQNILKSVQANFWEFAKSARSGSKPLVYSLHQFFHHLNSSQAMCFNLFYPFLTNLSNPNILAATLAESAVETVAEAIFEHVEDEAEGTNFDFFLRFQSGRKWFFECKYTEEEFGRAKNDERHRAKLKEIYTEKLEGKVSPEAVDESTFFANYQLLRNISHVIPKNGDRLFVIFPRGNSNIYSPLNRKVDIIKTLLLPKTLECVSVLRLEDLVNRFKQSPLQNKVEIKTHWQLFEEKYLPPLE